MRAQHTPQSNHQHSRQQFPALLIDKAPGQLLKSLLSTASAASTNAIPVDVALFERAAAPWAFASDPCVLLVCPVCPVCVCTKRVHPAREGQQPFPLPPSDQPTMPSSPTKTKALTIHVLPLHHLCTNRSGRLRRLVRGAPSLGAMVLEATSFEYVRIICFTIAVSIRGMGWGNGAEAFVAFEEGRGRGDRPIRMYNT